MTAVEPVQVEPLQRTTLGKLGGRLARWFLGWCALAIPAVGIIANQTWSHEEGAHGPLGSVHSGVAVVASVT